MISSTSIIGPNVSIGKNSYLENCTITNSIVMDDCIINAPIKIVDSIIADGTEIKNIGDDNTIFLKISKTNQVNIAPDPVTPATQ